MRTSTEAPPTQVYQVFIKATPERIWEALTTPELTARYFHGAQISIAGGRYLARGTDGSTWGDEEVIEADRRAGSCTAGARCTTRRWAPSQRAA